MSFVPRSAQEEAHEWPSQLEHLSASSFKMIARCPEQWRQRYILGRKAPPALALLVGGADHAAISHSMEQKVESFTDLPLPIVKDFYVNELEQRVENSGGLGEIEVRGAETKKDKQKEYDRERGAEGQEVLAMYHTRVAPTIQPTEVERSYSIEVPGVPVPIIGYIDLVAGPREQTLMDPNRLSIIERKRRTSAKRKPEPEWTLQGEIYQLFVPENYQFHISVASRNPYVLTPSQEPALEFALAPRKRSEMMVQQLAAEIAFLYMRFGPEHPWPAKGKLHPWACNYCGYRDDCWGWKQ